MTPEWLGPLPGLGPSDTHFLLTFEGDAGEAHLSADRLRINNLTSRDLSPCKAVHLDL